MPSDIDEALARINQISTDGWFTSMLSSDLQTLIDEVTRLRADAARRHDRIHPSWQTASREQLLAQVAWGGAIIEELLESQTRLATECRDLERQRDEARSSASAMNSLADDIERDVAVDIFIKESSSKT